MKLTCNMHTHTAYCDGKNTPRETVEAAISVGCTTLGFSGHSFTNVKELEPYFMRREAEKEYLAEINGLKEEYRGRIEILAGIEQDYYSGMYSHEFDYAIGSVHGVSVGEGFFSVDNTPEELLGAVDKYYGGNIMKAVKDYYSLVADVVDKTGCEIVGHFDVVTKFDEKRHLFDTSSKEYKHTALEALDALIEKDRIFEINTGAISRGWRTTPYPQDFILKRLAQKGANIMINSDSHSKDTVLFGFEDALEYARSCGVKELCVYRNAKFEKISI